MYFSPRKNLTRFYQYHTQDLTNLKHYPYPNKINYEDLLIAKKHLNMLRQTYNQLALQDFAEMKRVSNNSSQAVNELLHTKKQISRKLLYKDSEIQQLEEINDSAQKKCIQVEQQLKATQEQKNIAQVQLNQKRDKVLQLEQTVQQLIQSIQIDTDINTQITNTKFQLSKKVRLAESDQEKTAQTIKKTQENITVYKNQIKQLQYAIKSQNLQIENYKLKLQNQQKNKQNLQHRLSISINKVQKNIEDNELFVNQSTTQQNIQQLIQISTNNLQSYQQQSTKYRNLNNQLTHNIVIEEIKKKQLDQICQKKKQKIQQLKQKNQSIRKLLNSIFEEDSLLVKLITDKKVYPSIQVESQIIQTYQPNTEETQLKETNNNTQSKAIEQADTSDNFFPSKLIE